MIGYRGTRYAGWAIQPAAVTHGRPTLQATLQDALQDALGHPGALQCAGRTDAGVHADAQVVTFGTSSSIPPNGLLQVLPRRLPDDVWLLEAAEVEPSFDARRSALRRWYRYAIWQSASAPPAAWQGRCLIQRGPLSVAAMRQAAQLLLGRHDFGAFATSPTPSSRSTVRTVYIADWLEVEPAALLLFEVCADAFLKQMVRTIVGSLLWVGSGHWSVDRFSSALASADRRQAGPTAPASGLSLHRIDYPRSTQQHHAQHPEDV